MSQTHKDKIVVIGAGNVGEAIAYTLMVRVQANDIVLIDVNEDRAKGASLDIGQGTSFFKQVWVRQGGYEDIMKYAENPLILVVSNPADIMTAAVVETSGLPRHRVIGSGTSLDTARLRYFLSKKLQVNMANIRRKFKVKPGEAWYIANELGVGYRMNGDREV